MAKATKKKASGGRSARSKAQRIGYARVSTATQNLDSQRDALEAAGCTRVFEDTISGTTKERPGWDALLEYARGGDTLVIAELSRMSRSLLHLLQVVADLEERELGIVSLRENIDTTTATGRLFLSIMGAVSQMERELRAERAAAGRAAARARGRSGGRPRTSRDTLEKGRLLYESKVMSAAEAAAAAGTSRRALFRHMAEVRRRNEALRAAKADRRRPASTGEQGQVAHAQLRVRLLGTKVWRRLRLPLASSFDDLHQLIQESFGWEAFHLFRFRAGVDGFFRDSIASHPQLGSPSASAVRLVDHLSHRGDECVYDYDMGDDWNLSVEVQNVRDFPEAEAWVLAGGGTAPPEDCGGVLGFRDLLKEFRKGRLRRGTRELVGSWRPDDFDKGSLPRRSEWVEYV